MPPGHLRALNACIHRLSGTFRHCFSAAKAAAAVAAATPATPAGGIAAAALLDTSDDATRGALLAAYVDNIVAAKERLPDATAHAWASAAARLTCQEVALAVDKFMLMAKRSAETALANSRGLFSPAALDLSPVAPEATAALVPLLRHSKEVVVTAAAAALNALAARLRSADALATAACAVVAVLDGSAGGAAPKSTKDRAVFARTVRAMCPDASDRHALRALTGDVRAAFLRVTARLVAVAKCEVTTDGKAAELSAAREWALAGAMHDLHAQTTPCSGETAAARRVALTLAEVAGSADGEVRRAALTAGAALAVDAALGAELAPLRVAAEGAVRDGASKVALRTEGVAGLALAAAIAAKADNSSWELFAGGGAAVQLLHPTALASVGAAGLYAAAAAAAAAASDAASVDADAAVATALAALLLGNESLPRVVALCLARRELAARPRLAVPMLTSLAALVDAYPDIPTIQAPAVAPSEPPSHTGARSLSPRILAAASLLCSHAAANPALAAQFITLLHHPVTLGLRSGGAPARHLLSKGGLTSGALLATCAETIGDHLNLSSTTAVSHSDTVHAAAQAAIGSCLALCPESVWPVCLAHLQQLMSPQELHELVDNDIRIFQTPRGRLMVEEFGSQLSPDELFAVGSRQASARASEVATGANGFSKKGGAESHKGGKKAAISKESQQRQEQLAVEVRRTPVCKSWMRLIHSPRCSGPVKMFKILRYPSALCPSLLMHVLSLCT